MMFPRQPGNGSIEGANSFLAVAADGLSFAAAPTFAMMALLTAYSGGGAPHMLCAQDAAPLSGMLPMYVVMIACHLPPWLRLLAPKRYSLAESQE